MRYSIDAGMAGGRMDSQMLVGARWPAAVNALSMAMLMDVIFAPSMRWKAMRWVDESTTAMSIRRNGWSV
jgi:hypothetical protein